ncbi:MAG TPA: MFS transporter [Longimicrobiales bacterium]|nr:MFS transporter [Longimicrobiales bacterium]
MRPASKLRVTLRALESRNFRLFFIGQTVSLVGTWIQQIAMSWLVYRLTNSPFVLGAVGFAGQLPSFLVAPFAGVLADRWDRRRTVVGTQVLSMVQALVLAALVFSGRVEVWHVMALSVFLGIVNAADVPTRQSFLVEMVEDRELLANAIALNSSMFNAARLVGPALAGIVIAAVGEGICFLLNGLSYIAVIAALLAMRVPPREIPLGRPRLLGHLREGFDYAWGVEPIRIVLLLLAITSVVGVPYTVLMPVFATRVLNGGADTLGLLMAATGLGALAGALYLASRESVLGLGRLIAVASGVFGVGLIAFAASRTLWLSLPLLVVTGFGMMVQMAASNTVLQTVVDEDKRGRIMALYTMAYLGMIPFGSLLAGILADGLGAPETIALGGALSLAGTLYFLSRLPRLQAQIRPADRSAGIVPEVATGLQTASSLMVPPKRP